MARKKENEVVEVVEAQNEDNTVQHLDRDPNDVRRKPVLDGAGESPDINNPEDGNKTLEEFQA